MSPNANVSRAMSRRLALVALLLVSACFLRAKPGESSEPLPDPIPILVRNENFLDMNVYASAGGMQRRLGMVPGNSSGSFTIPWNFGTGQGIVITAVPIGGRGSASSGALNVGIGQMIDFLVASQLRQSVARVYEP